MEQRGVGVRRLGAWSFSEKKLGKDFFAPGSSVQLVEKSRSGQENPRNPSAFLGKIWPGYAQIWLDLARFGLSLEIGRLPCRRLRRRRGRCYAPRLRSFSWEARAGGVAERSKAHAWKVCIRETVSRVRIPPPPPKTDKPKAGTRLDLRPGHSTWRVEVKIDYPTATISYSLTLRSNGSAWLLMR